MKELFPDHIIFIQNGYFFEIYEYDADVCSNLFGWKISSDRTYKFTGVPINAFKFKDFLKKQNRPYIIVIQEERIGTTKSINRFISEIFPKTQTEDHHDKEYWIKKAEQYENNDQFQQAINCYERAVQKDPDDPVLWNNLGVCYYQIDQHEKAIDCYEKSIQIDTNDTTSWLNKGIAFEDLERYNDALYCYSLVLDMDPENIEALINKGDVLKELGQYDRAIRCYQSIPDNHLKTYNISERIEWVKKILREKIKQESKPIEIKKLPVITQKNPSREEAEQVLKKIFGFNSFYDRQWETIKRIFQGKKILLIEKTGFGKSLCYQFPATQFAGITVIFSPLIALMRDQVNMLRRKGISAQYINSEQTEEENEQTMQDAIEGKIKILYIAPERQENKQWIEATRYMNLSMIVIDEAHTISVWGHDFRPSFRRIINLVHLLPEGLPVLATTATATKRVQKDIEKQISDDVYSIRGNLMRENLYLSVIETSSEEEKYKWLADHLNDLPGSGLIYTGTRVNTEKYSRWLNFMNIPCRGYNAGLDGKTRKEIEQELMDNKWKAIITTNALGMGIDKPDIRFIIHTQIPASPIHYYQEIGRAGRDGKKTYIILFYNSNKDDNGISEDYKLPRSFIDNGKPKVEKYYRIIKELKEEQLGIIQLMRKSNLKMTQVRVIIADLIDQGIIKEVYYERKRKFEYQFDAPELNTDYFEELRQTKLKELDSMVDYVYTKKPRMKFLCDYLGDVMDHEYVNCDNTSKIIFKNESNDETIWKLKEFQETYYPILHVKKPMINLKNGIAASYYGDSNVGSILHRCKYEDGGDFPDHIIRLTLKAFHSNFKDRKFDLIVYVPPTCSGDLVRNFTETLSTILKIPISHKLIKKRDTKPQKIFQNHVLKRENVQDAFDYENQEEIKGKDILLVDDVYDTGATIKEIGKMLSNLGASSVTPMVIARTVGGDI